MPVHAAVQQEAESVVVKPAEPVAHAEDLLDEQVDRYLERWLPVRL